MIKSSHFHALFLPVLVLLIAVMIWSVGYNTPRENFIFFISQYLVVFLSFYILWLKTESFSFFSLLSLAIGFRLILLFSIPELSNDFYRFIWDGELLNRGINPFAHKPNELISQIGFMDESYMRILYHGMGELSQEHYTCYPVINQLLFLLTGGSNFGLFTNIIILKIIILLGDIGTLLIARKMAIHLKISVHRIWLYGLNPFIILEFSGNLHFEGVMIFFLLLAIYFGMRNNWLKGGIFLALAVQIKLVPLMLIPFFYKKFKWINSISFTAVVLLFVLLIGGILLNDIYLNNMMESVNEYFVSFQFNAGIFNIIRWFGFQLYGWDPIQFVGPILSGMATIGILCLAAFKAFRSDIDIVKGMLFAFVIYYSFSTTVHPWYISLVLVLSVFTHYKFGVVWSLLIMLSYFAYSNPDFNENYLLIFVEYGLVYSVMFYEIFKYWKKGIIGFQLVDFFKHSNKN